MTITDDHINMIISKSRKDCRTVSSGEIRLLCREIERLRRRQNDLVLLLHTARLFVDGVVLGDSE